MKITYSNKGEVRNNLYGYFQSKVDFESTFFYAQ